MSLLKRSACGRKVLKGCVISLIYYAFKMSHMKRVFSLKPLRFFLTVVLSFFCAKNQNILSHSSGLVLARLKRAQRPSGGAGQLQPTQVERTAIHPTLALAKRELRPWYGGWGGHVHANTPVLGQVAAQLLWTAPTPRALGGGGWFSKQTSYSNASHNNLPAFFLSETAYRFSIQTRQNFILMKAYVWG